MSIDPKDYNYEKAIIDILSSLTKPRSRPSQNPVFHKTAGANLVEDVGSRLAKCTLDSYIVTVPGQQSLKDTIEKYASDIYGAIDECRQLFLYGPCGGGKDHVTMHVARAALCKGYSVRCVSGPRFRAQIRDSIGQEKESAILQPYYDCDFLWLSDPVVNGKPLSPYQAEIMYALVDHRWRNSKPIWTTVNLHTPTEAAEDLGAAVFDRLRHNAVVHYCDWDTSRVKAQNK